MMTWAEVARLSERGIIRHSGVTMQALDTIRNVWSLKTTAQQLIGEFAKSLPREAYGSFDQLIDAYIATFAGQDARKARVLKGRLGFLDGRRWTLEELGALEAISRERIRQIHEILTMRMQGENSSMLFKRLWMVVSRLLTESGGACCATEVAEYLAKYFNWTVLPDDIAIVSLFNSSTEFAMHGVVPINIVQHDNPCINCSEIRVKLSDEIISRQDGTLPFTEAVNILHAYCQERHCAIQTGIPLFAKGFLYFLGDVIEDIFADRSRLYSKSSWEMKISQETRASLIQQIMINAGRPLHVDEVMLEMNKKYAAHFHIHVQSTTRNILSTSPDIYSYHSGTYIHRSLVDIHMNIIADIADSIEESVLANGEISIIDVFIKNQSFYLMNGIRTPYLLYSLFNKSFYDRFDMVQFPRIRSFSQTHMITIKQEQSDK